MNELFPGLVASFNDGSLFIPGNTSDVAQITKRIYSGITNLADGTMNNRLKEERNYAIKQGAIFGTTAAVVGGTVGAAIHGVMSL